MGLVGYPSFKFSVFQAKKDDIPKQESKEVSVSNIDRVCQLIHELKEQDLQNHKRRIEEQVRSEILFDNRESGEVL